LSQAKAPEFPALYFYLRDGFNLTKNPPETDGNNPLSRCPVARFRESAFYTVSLCPRMIGFFKKRPCRANWWGQGVFMLIIRQEQIDQMHHARAAVQPRIGRILLPELVNFFGESELRRRIVRAV
jgi:hypothetical protein